MNAYNNIFGRRFFTSSLSVCALCAMLVVPAFGQDGADPVSEPPASQPPVSETPAVDESDVDVTDYGTVNLTVKDTDLSTVLEMLSIESQKNIITSKSVSATVTANLYDVTFYEALDAILLVNGYRYREQGNFIYIYTLEEFIAQEEAGRMLESRVFTLDYISAAAAHEAISPLLSESGDSSFIGDAQMGFQPSISDAGADGWAFTPKIIVNDFAENLDAVADLLTELDVEPQQVLVEATIVQSQLDEANAFGVDFSVIGSLDFTDLTNPLSGVGNLLQGNDTGSDVSATAGTGFEPGDGQGYAMTSGPGNVQNGAGTLKIGVIHNDVSVFLRVLDEVTNNTVLAKPKIMCLNRQRAEVLVGARVGYLSTTATETTTTQSVEFLDTGIHLVFRPFISSNGMVRMELSPSVSEASLRTVTDSNGALVTIPDELTNELTSNVRVKDGQTLVLGGLFRESTRVTRRQVPFLGDIPVLGAAFRGQDDAVNRSEIIFLITPTIVKDQSLWAMGEESLDYADAITVGARAGLLPFSREQLTQNYNQDAWDAYQAGDTEKALYYLNHSLRMNSVQPEMIRLREEITGNAENSYQRSIMQRVIDGELGRGYSAQAEPVEQDDEQFADAQEAPMDEADPFAELFETFVAEEPMESETGEALTDTEGEGEADTESGEEAVTFVPDDASAQGEPEATPFDPEFPESTPAEPEAGDTADPEFPTEAPTEPVAEPTAAADTATDSEFGFSYEAFMQELFAMMGLPDLLEESIAEADAQAQGETDVLVEAPTNDGE